LVANEEVNYESMKSLLHSPWVRRLWNIVGGVSIQVKVLGIVLGVILLLSAFVIVQMRAVLTNSLLRELSEQGIAISEGIGHEVTRLLAGNQIELLHFYLQDRQIHYSSSSHNTVVPYIILEDAADQSILSAAGRAAPTDLLTTETGFHLPPATQVAIGSEVIEIITPLPEVDALLHLGLARANVEATVRSVIMQLLAITGLMIAVGFAAAIFLTWILTRPLLSLVSATQAVAQGDLSRRVPRWANDEIGELSIAFNRMMDSLQRAQQEERERAQLRERYVSGVILAQESERQRIARELHDSTSQSLTSLLVGLQNLKVAVDNPQCDRPIEELRQVVGRTLDEVRTLSWRLRPSALDDLGLVSALHHYIEDYHERYGIQVDFFVRGLQGRLPPEMETSIYRIVQEGLTNIARYAQTDHASIILNRREEGIRLIIEDNGIGFDPALVEAQNRSLGLQGIRERAALFGGSLTIESQPGMGTSLFVELPYADST
jgi:signal transduction histidine kinase